MENSDFYCTCCGQKGIKILRGGNKRESGHLKKLWCLHCRKETNHVEVKYYTHYDLKDFNLEYNYGNFDEKGNRIMPYGLFKQKTLKEKGIEVYE